MKNTAIKCFDAFYAHISQQESSRQKAKISGEDYAPTSSDKEERELLMSQLLDSLGLEKNKLQALLSIDRATWDRWRSMSSIPHKSHLDAISRFARESDAKNDHSVTKPRPHDLLSARPRTWGRLRLVYSLFEWENAVFWFHTPFSDSKTATEMALLALRGCKIVYFLSDPDGWKSGFSAQMEKVLGKNDAARALSKICIAKIPKDIDIEENNFGIFNYESSDPNMCVGYTWKGNNERPEDEVSELYDAFPATDYLISDLRQKCGPQINKAFAEIDKNRFADLWSPILESDTRAARLNIPIIE